MRHAFRHSVAPWVFLQRRNLCSSIPFGLKALLYTHPPLLNFHGCVTSSSPGGGWLCWEMLFRALPRASPCAWEGRERWAAVVSCDAMKSEPLCIHRRHPSTVRRGGLRGDLTLHTHTHTHTYTAVTPALCLQRGNSVLQSEFGSEVFSVHGGGI